MGIFSFGKKDDAPTRRGANSSSSRGSRAERTERAERVERRSRRTDRSGDADAMLLDPTLPEKQRARRRLVGAIALVIAAVVILPMVLDSHPKPVTDDISIDIPSRPAPKPRASVDNDTQAAVAPDNPAAPDAALAACLRSRKRPLSSPTTRRLQSPQRNRRLTQSPRQNRNRNPQPRKRRKQPRRAPKRVRPQRLRAAASQFSSARFRTMPAHTRGRPS